MMMMMTMMMMTDIYFDPRWALTTLEGTFRMCADF